MIAGESCVSERWAEAYACQALVRWYRDKFTGRTMSRPAWSKLEAEIVAGRVSKVVVWRRCLRT